MFVSFARQLKRMGGIRLGVGVRVTRKNAWYILFAFFFIMLARLMWYMVIAAGWMLFGMCWLLYKCYYYMFKGAAIGVKKLYGFIKSKVQPKSEV